MPRETLRNIISQYGTSVCEDPRRVENLLRDLCGQHKREISVLVVALQEQVAEQLSSSQDGIPPKVVLGRLAKRLTDNRAIVPADARWAVESWALALGVVSQEDVSQPPGGTTTLKPYVFRPGHVARTVRDLPSVFDADWDRALEHFEKRYIVDWLRDNMAELRATHRHGPADQLEHLVARAEETIGRPRDGSAHRQSIELERFLRVLGAEAPTLDIQEPTLFFPAVGQGTGGEPVTLSIFNPERGYLHGRVESKVSWLEVKPKTFGCPAGRKCEIEVRPDFTGFSVGHQRVADALQVESNGGNVPLSVEMEILPPPKLAVDALQLDFGSIGLGYTGEVTFEVRNTGGALLSGTVDSQIPGLSPSPTRFQVRSRGSTAIEVTADSDLLKPGAVSEPDALVVNSNGGQHRIHALVQVRPPCLSVDAEHICVPSGPEGKRPANLRVTNTGAGILEFHASIEDLAGSQTHLYASLDEPFLEGGVPSQVALKGSCSPGESKTLHLAARGPERSRDAPGPDGRLILESNGGDKEIPLFVHLNGPRLYVEAAEIDLGCYAAPPPPTGLLRLTNLGNEPFKGHIQIIQKDGPWLESTASVVQLQPRESVAVELRPMSEGRVKLALGVLRRRLSSVIRIRWSGGKVEIPVKMVTEYHG